MSAAPFDLLVVLGPTASGKTRLGVELCRHLEGEILSADSRQVFRGMDIGTGKDLAEYGATPYHLIDIVEPGEEFSLFDFQRRCLQAIVEIRNRNRLPVLVGGTGLYLDAVLRRYRLAEVPPDPELRAGLASQTLEQLIAYRLTLEPKPHNTSDFRDRDHLIRAIEIALATPEAGAAELPEFPDLTPLVLGLRWERQALRKRIEARLRERLDHGLIEEVAQLHLSGVSFETLDGYGLEYRFVARFLRGEITAEELFEQLFTAIRAFAKRQSTWFRRMERLGVPIQWLDGERDPLGAALALTEARRP